MRGIDNENTFMIVDQATGIAVAEMSNTFAAKYQLKIGFVYMLPSDYLPTLNQLICRAHIRKDVVSDFLE